MSGGEVGWRDGRRRREFGPPVTGTGVCRSGCVRSPSSPFPRPSAGRCSSGVVRGGTYAAVWRSGASFGAKPVTLAGLGGVWMQGGGLGGGRRDVCGRSSRLRCWCAAISTRVVWLRVVGGGRVRWRGVSAGYTTCSWADGGDVRGRRILHQGSVAVFPLLRDAPGENLIFVIGRWRLPIVVPFWRHRPGVPAPSLSASPLLGRLRRSPLAPSDSCCLVVVGVAWRCLAPLYLPWVCVMCGGRVCLYRCVCMVGALYIKRGESLFR